MQLDPLAAHRGAIGRASLRLVAGPRHPTRHGLGLGDVPSKGYPLDNPGRPSQPRVRVLLRVGREVDPYRIAISRQSKGQSLYLPGDIDRNCLADRYT